MEETTAKMRTSPIVNVDTYALKQKICSMPGTILNRLTKEHVFNLACIAFNETGQNANPNTWRKEAVTITKKNDLVVKIEFNDLYDSKLIFEEVKENNSTQVNIVRHGDGWIGDMGVQNPEMFYLYLKGIAEGLIK